MTDEEKRPKVARYGDLKLLEEYPGQVDQEAERLYLQAHPNGSWHGLVDFLKSVWRNRARREIVKARELDDPEIL